MKRGIYMKNIKRIAALIAAFLLLGLFILLLCSALFTTPESAALFNASLFSIMAIPLFLFAIILVYRLVKDKNNDNND